MLHPKLNTSDSFARSTGSPTPPPTTTRTNLHPLPTNPRLMDSTPWVLVFPFCAQEAMLNFDFAFLLLVMFCFPLVESDQTAPALRSNRYPHRSQRGRHVSEIKHLRALPGVGQSGLHHRRLGAGEGPQHVQGVHREYRGEDPVGRQGRGPLRIPSTWACL